MKVRSKRELETKDYVVVDFSGVGSRNKVVKAGNYRVQVMKVTKGISKPGNPKLDWIFIVSAGPEEGHRFQPYTTSLMTQSLWNLRGVLEALGVEVPEGPLQIVYRELKGLELGLTVEHETYQKRVKERIIDLFPLEELGGAVIEEGEEEEEGEDSGETPLEEGPDMPESMKREEAAKLTKQVEEETGRPGEIKIEEEETEEEEEEEDE